jgi:hypothetical protein
LGELLSCESIDDDGQFRHNSSVHLLKRFSLMGNLSQDSHPSGGASHHHVTYPLVIPNTSNTADLFHNPKKPRTSIIYENTPKPRPKENTSPGYMKLNETFYRYFPSIPVK